MGLLHKIKTFREMGPRGRDLYFEALLLPLAIRLSFRFRGVRQTQIAVREWAGRNPRLPLNAAHAISEARRAQRTAKRTAGVDGTCLVRTLALWAILSRRGVATEPRWGARKESDGSTGLHAWLEHNGHPINEDPAVVATYSVYSAPAWFDMRQV